MCSIILKIAILVRNRTVRRLIMMVGHSNNTFSQNHIFASVNFKGTGDGKVDSW